MKGGRIVWVLVFCGLLLPQSAGAFTCDQVLQNLWSPETQAALDLATERFLNLVQVKYPRFRPGIFVNWKWHRVVQVLGKGGEGKVFLVTTKDGLQVVKNWRLTQKQMPTDMTDALRKRLSSYAGSDSFRGLEGMAVFEVDHFLKRHRTEYVPGLPLPLIHPWSGQNRYVDPRIPLGIDLGLTQKQRLEIWGALRGNIPLLEVAFRAFNRQNLVLDVRRQRVVLIDVD